MPKSISDQMNFEDLCHLQAFKGTDHLSRSVSQQLIPSLVERLNLWLNLKSAGKAGKLRAILRKANTPIELTASTILKTVFELEGQETSTIINKLTRAFILEEEYQTSLSGLKGEHGKAMAERVAHQMKNKPTFKSRLNHMRKTQERLTRIAQFDKQLYNGIGAMFLDLVLELKVYTQGKTFNVFELTEGIALKNSQGRVKKSKPIVFTSDFNHWFGLKVQNVMASAFALKPTLVKPKKWEGLTGGGYYTHRGHLHWQFIRNVDLNLYSEKDVPNEIYEAVNAIQETPWRINNKVLKVMAWAVENRFNIGGIKTVDTRIGKKERLNTMRNLIARDAWDKLSEGERIDAIKTRDKKVTTDMRNESQADKVSKQVAFAHKFSKYDEIFFPHAIDFRGRIYPIPCAVNPQADKLGQALLEFAHGEPLGETGRYWLAVQGANTYGQGKDKLKMDERVAFIEGMTQEINDIASNPLKYRDLWCPVDDKGKCKTAEPFEFLKFCFEWSDMLKLSDSTKFVSRISVKLDATCSGLQHYSAMLRDERGALATNIGDNEERQDIYNEAGNEAKGIILDELVSINVPVEKQWKRSFIDCITRDIAKPPCMTLPYGVSTFGITDKLIEQSKEGKLVNAYFDQESNGKERMGKLRWFAQKLEQGVADTVPSAVEAMSWLKACDKILGKSLPEDVHYEFRSPVGLSIKQARKKERTKRLESFFGVSKIRIQYSTRIKEKAIDRAKSNTSIAPNFVHAQDASHLTNVALRAKRELGLKSFSFIHDSFGVHPSEMCDFLPIIKQEFHKLYSGDRLNELRTYWQDRYEVELPPAPTQGKFNVDSILDSKFIFS